LLEPPNDNARYYYELALSNDPGNATAVAGLGMIISRLVLDARAAIDAGNFRTAARLLDDARAINAESSEVTAASRALDDARQREADAAQRDVERRAAAEREAARAAADKPAAASQPAAAPTAASTGSSQNPANASAIAAEAAEPARQADAPDTAVAAATPAEQGPVPISTLTRTKYVAPRYPRAAERRSLSGWVDVVFTVRIDGSVGDIEVRESEPGDVFVNAAIKAVEKWEFEPVVENDRYVEKQAGVRLMFAIE
jgi:TonB family protein